MAKSKSKRVNSIPKKSHGLQDQLPEACSSPSPSIWDEMHRMQEQMDRMHEAFLGDNFFSRSLMGPFSYFPLSRDVFSSRSELFETPTEVKAEIALPGMDKKDIQLHFSENVLEVRAQKHAEKSGGDDSTRNFSRSYSSFYRSFVLPRNVDVSKARAKLENGLLRITIPKTSLQKSNSRTLEIE